MEEKKKKITIAIVGVLIAIVFIIGISYALWTFTKAQTGVNTITTGCLNVTFTDQNAIDLKKAYPLTNSEGEALTPYEFTIENTCDTDIEYTLHLEMLNETTLNSSYVAIKLNNEEKKLLNSLTEETPIESGMKEARKLEEPKKLKGGSSVSYSLRLWLDESVGLEDDAQNKTFSSKIVLNGVPTVIEPTATKKLTELAKTDTTNLAYDGTVDNNLRYIGANPNNYVSFNNELWRIIGVMNDVESEEGTIEPRIKLIKSESLGGFYWDYKQSGVGSSTSNVGSNDWSDSQLMMMLNPTNRVKSDYTVDSEGYVTSGEIKLLKIPGSYYNRTNGYKPASATTTAFTEEPIDFSSTGLTNEARNMIQAVKWKLGGSPSNNIIPSMYYERERGDARYNESRPLEWTGEVGLMYPSDYGYATSGGTTTNREACLAEELFNWYTSSVSDCENNDWLYKENSSQWTLSPNSFYAGSVFTVASGGAVLYDNAKFTYAVHPVVYLASNTTIIDGEGTTEKPYILKQG